MTVVHRVWCFYDSNYKANCSVNLSVADTAVNNAMLLDVIEELKCLCRQTMNFSALNLDNILGERTMSTELLN